MVPVKVHTEAGEVELPCFEILQRVAAMEALLKAHAERPACEGCALKTEVVKHKQNLKFVNWIGSLGIAAGVAAFVRWLHSN